MPAIITHDFKAADLHKLDPTNRDKETAHSSNDTINQFEGSHSTTKEYKTPFTVLILLQTYLNILAYHVNEPTATGGPSLKTVAEDYSQWGRRDDLLLEHVHGHQKPAPAKHSKGSSADRPSTNIDEVWPYK
ncbi:hypothetical protein C0992_006805 [Termitomyces sp. T32_za158]|nr:hypothetical protein C0992_006805 [Termitomyces sp. T32_za158]